MAGLDQAHANAILDASFDEAGASVRLSTGSMRLRLMTANGSATSNGTELGTGGGYTSGGGGSHTISMANAASGSKASDAAFTVTSMPAATIVGVEVWDSAGSPARKWWGALSANKTTNSGDTFSIASGSLTASLT